jgi:hypothetical protein
LCFETARPAEKSRQLINSGATFWFRLNRELAQRTKCDRKGPYHVHKLIEKYGRKGNMMKWREMLNADCPKRDASECNSIN